MPGAITVVATTTPADTGDTRPLVELMQHVLEQLRNLQALPALGLAARRPSVRPTREHQVNSVFPTFRGQCKRKGEGGARRRSFSGLSRQSWPHGATVFSAREGATGSAGRTESTSVHRTY
jgi:hypothetical protein